MVLLKRQLLLYRKVAREPNESMLRQVTFVPHTRVPVTDSFVRKVGRPRAEWAREVGALALKIAGSTGALDNAISSDIAWKRFISECTF